MSAAAHLSPKHRAMLYDESGIAPEIVAERGTFTAWRGEDVPQECGKLPAKPGVIFPVHTLDGGRFYRLRPNNPGRLAKYMQPKGMPNRLDVHPHQHERIRRPGGMRYVTEGERKVDAGVSRGLLMVGQSGVFNGQRDKGASLIDDYDLLPIEGEKYSICYDSDIHTNRMVQLAADRQARLLRERGAQVFITLLPPASDGTKQGLDDFFANGGTVKDLEMLTHPYSPMLIERARLSRDERLHASIKDLESRFWSHEWKGQGGHSDRDVYLKLVEAARRHGRLVADGVRVVKAQGPLANEAKVNARTLWKALNRLEDAGLLYRDNEGRKADKPGAFVLRASVSHSRQSNESEDNVTHTESDVYARDLQSRGLMRAPRLRWSQPRYTPKRGLVSGSRKVRQAPRPQSRPAIKRLGKIRGSIIDALDAAGGTLTLKRIAEILHKRRPRDIRRRNLPMLEHAGIVEVNGDQVSLSANWLEALQEQRRLGKETDSRVVLTYEDGRERVRERVVAVEGIETIARRRYEIKRDAYREYLQGKRSTKRKTDRGRSEASVESVKLSHDARDAWLAAQAAKPEPTTYLTAEQSARVDTLVSQGMKEEFAVAEVTRTVSLFDERPKPKPERKMPPKRNGIYVHVAECDCWLCSSEASEEIETGNRRAG
jgi:Domain of unknown function (DUF3854)